MNTCEDCDRRATEVHWHAEDGAGAQPDDPVQLHHFCDGHGADCTWGRHR